MCPFTHTCSVLGPGLVSRDPMVKTGYVPALVSRRLFEMYKYLTAKKKNVYRAREEKNKGRRKHNNDI